MAGESIGATEHAWLGNARRLGNPSVVQFYSGPLMHFLSGVDTMADVDESVYVLRKLAYEIDNISNIE